MNRKIVIISGLAAMAILGVITWRLFSLQTPFPESPTGPAAEEITAFNYERLESGVKLVVTGEAATVSPEKDTTVKTPSAQIETREGKIILVDTAPSGTAEITFDSKSGQLKTMVLKGGVKITRKDKKSGQIEFTAESEQADFKYATEEITLTGHPVVHQGENEFQGETIRYLLKDGKIFIEKGASGKVYYEEKKP